MRVTMKDHKNDRTPADLAIRKTSGMRVVLSEH